VLRRSNLAWALQIAHYAPVWPNTPAGRTRIEALSHALPWETNPASHPFPQQHPVTMLPVSATPTIGQALFPRPQHPET
jgi:hypothetical protein